jgi:hypothetical protein
MSTEIRMQRNRHTWWILILLISTILGAYGVYLDRQTTPPSANTVNPQPDTSSSPQPVIVVYKATDPQLAREQEQVVNEAAGKWAGKLTFEKVDPRAANNRAMQELSADSSRIKFVVVQGGKPLNTHTGFLDATRMDSFIRESGVTGPPTSIPNKQPMR